ncbi:hypothetical protein ACFYT4_09905 [Streptomyces sp. NPDC004609]|uniref:hypothetical protein n=1 Tax=Streptomyces sp. NPDC004609 TaxID=3364704 RepID=UPI00368C20F9
MTSILGERWGGCTVSDAVVELLLRAQRGAVRDRSDRIGLRHLTAALGEPEAPGAPGPAGWRAVLLASGFPEEQLTWQDPRPRTAPAIGDRPDELPLPDEELRELLGQLSRWARTTGDDRATTAHLVAALAGTGSRTGSDPGDPRAGLHRLGLTADTVLRAAARHRPAEPDEDTAFLPPAGVSADRVSAGRVPPDRVQPDGVQPDGVRPGTNRAVNTGEQGLFPVPPPPTADELRVRTGKRMSPLFVRLFALGGPDSGKEMGAPVGLARLRQLAALILVNYVLATGTVLSVIVSSYRTGPLWLLLVLPLTWLPLDRVPLPVWLVTKAATAWFVPWPFGWLVVCWMAGEALQLRTQLWIFRASLGSPVLTRAALVAENRQKAADTLIRRFGGSEERAGAPATWRPEERNVL